MERGKRKKDEYKASLKKGEIEADNIGFEDWCQKWVKAYKKDKIKVNTLELGIMNSINNHYIPYFKNTPLKNIRQIDVQTFFATKSDYSHHMLKKLRGTLFSIFERAVDNEIIYRNPVKNIEIPKGKQSEEKRCYTRKQSDTIIEFAKNHRYGASIIFVLKTGVRRGELLGIKWTDIDMENKVLHLQRAVADVVIDGRYQVQIDEGNTSTKNHKRDIPFDDELKNILTELPHKGEFVFPNSKGEVNSPIVRTITQDVPINIL